MTVKSVEKDEKHLVTLTIEVGAAEFEKAVQKAYTRGAGRINVPGFRRGKAPRKMIETMYGAGVFYEDAVNLSYSDALEEAVREAGIELVEQADIEILDVGQEGYTFTARAHERPEAEVRAYRGLAAFRPPVDVGEEDVDAELERMRNRNARLVTAERPIQDGDTAVIDFEGFLDDVPFEGGKGENYQLRVGSGRFIPGFEEQLVGKAAGEECRVNVAFPEEYHAPELSGREAVFTVKVHEVKENEKPELDDEFAKDVSEFDTLSELRADIRERLTSERERMADEVFENGLVEKLLENTAAEIPDAMVEEQMSTLMQNFSYRLSAQQLDIASYLQFTGQTMEQWQSDIREQAYLHVKANLAYEKIAALENMEITDEELSAEYEKIAKQYEMSENRIRASMPERSLRRDILTLKASEFVKEQAEALSEEPAKPEKAKEKKTIVKAMARAEEPADGETPPKKPTAQKTGTKEST